MQQYETSTTTEYAGMWVRLRPDGRYHVTDEGGFTNLAPGATNFETREDALTAIDILRVVDGDGAKFWHLLRALQRMTGRLK